MNKDQLKRLRDSVQLNCHISDARYGTDYGLCTYLMKMREYFRWEHGIGFGESLGNEEVGDWLTNRERLWADLAETEFSVVDVMGQEYDPFDSPAINHVINRQGLVYSGGIGNSGKPHFFLAELEEQVQEKDYCVVVSGRELVRDLASPAAMSQRDTIFIRRESLRRVLWEKLESWRWNRPDNALGRAFSYYDFDHRLEQSLERMTENGLKTMLWHEQGECRAGAELGDAWNEMLMDLVHTPAELAARSVRDHLADCLVTIPALMEHGADAAIHFYIGNLTALQKRLFPGLVTAYESWRESKDGSGFLRLAEEGVAHWGRLAGEMKGLHASQGGECARPVMELVEQNTL